MSNRSHQDFNVQFIHEIMKSWKTAADTYEKVENDAYKKIRTYLTVYQFRLSNKEKCEIRETLSQFLDEIEKQNVIDEFDNYLDGFCFELDQNVIPSKQVKPTSVKIKIAENDSTKSISDPNLTVAESVYEPPEYDDKHQTNIYPAQEYTTDINEYDFYTMQFFQ